jgi:Cdc25 family phosphatase
MKYITGDELAAIIKSDKVPSKDYIVVDVRDDDWVGGNIKNSHNLPSYEFMRSVDGFVKKTQTVPTVIFHCALSQVRGPRAARIYQAARNRCQREGTDNHPHEVLVLQGGFSQFQTKFKDDADLVENWDKAVWAPDWD